MNHLREARLSPPLFAEVSDTNCNLFTTTDLHQYPYDCNETVSSSTTSSLSPPCCSGEVIGCSVRTCTEESSAHNCDIDFSSDTSVDSPFPFEWPDDDEIEALADDNYQVAAEDLTLELFDDILF